MRIGLEVVLGQPMLDGTEAQPELLADLADRHAALDELDQGFAGDLAVRGVLDGVG